MEINQMKQDSPTQYLRDCVARCDSRNNGGTMPLVTLSLGYQYFNADFIDKVLADVDKIPMRVALGEKITDLERLGYELLQIGVFAKK